MADNEKKDPPKEQPKPASEPPKGDKSPFREPGMQHFHGSRNYEEKPRLDRED
jgi:hypothetical protein